MAGQRPRRRLAISLRVLLLLVLAFGLWLGRQVHLAREQRLSVEAIDECGGSVTYAHELVTPGAEPPFPRWLLRLTGEDFFREVTEVELPYSIDDRGVYVALGRLHGVRLLEVYDMELADADLAAIGGLVRLEALRVFNPNDVTDHGIARLTGLHRLKTLIVISPKVTADGLARLAELRDLENLQIFGSQVTEAAVRRLAGLPKLRTLNLSSDSLDDDCLAALADMKGLTSLTLGTSDCRITDSGLASVGRLTALESLFVVGGRITDGGLVHLKDLSRLNSLDLSGTGVTAEGLGPLRGLTGLKSLAVPEIPNVITPEWAEGRR
jgi:hypothetical protein